MRSEIRGEGKGFAIALMAALVLQICGMCWLIGTLRHRSHVISRRPAHRTSSCSPAGRTSIATPRFLHVTKRTAAEPATGSLESYLADNVRPGLAQEKSALVASGDPGHRVDSEAAELLALDASDREYHETLLTARDAAARGQRGEALATLRQALDATPVNHRFARIHLLEALVELSLAVADGSDSSRYSEQLAQERAQVLQIATRCDRAAATDWQTRLESIERAGRACQALGSLVVALGGQPPATAQQGQTD